MRRLISLLLAIAMLLTLFGCEMKKVSEMDSSYSGYSTESSSHETSFIGDSSEVSSLLTSEPDSEAYSSDISKSAIASSDESRVSSSQGADISSVPSVAVSSKKEANSVSSSKDSEKKITVSVKDQMRAVWLSYIELNFVGKSEEEFQNTIDTYFDNIKDLGCNTVICHVVANCDAAYDSDIFPYSAAYSGKQGQSPGYDPLEYMVSAAKERGLSINAWINPYRVCAQNKKTSALAQNNPARKWLEDDSRANDDNVLFTDTGMYLNPAKEEVRKLVVSVVREILENYDVDGIQFDDYFYPVTDEKFDKTTYDNYKKGRATYLPLDEWRRTNVNLLVSSVYKAVHKYKGKVFGISPAAPISEDKTDKNYTEYYADIYSWMETKGYIDYIAPQLYFGYNYPKEEFRFDNILKSWTNAKRHKSVSLYIGLGVYKINTKDAETEEWIKDDEIISKQIRDIKKTDAEGFMLYSYSYLFSEDEKNRSALKKIRKTLK